MLAKILKLLKSCYKKQHKLNSNEPQLLGGRDACALTKKQIESDLLEVMREVEENIKKSIAGGKFYTFIFPQFTTKYRPYHAEEVVKKLLALGFFAEDRSPLDNRYQTIKSKDTNHKDYGLIYIKWDQKSLDEIEFRSSIGNHNHSLVIGVGGAPQPNGNIHFRLPKPQPTPIIFYNEYETEHDKNPSTEDQKQVSTTQIESKIKDLL